LLGNTLASAKPRSASPLPSSAVTWRMVMEILPSL
jgi:hypothetical protein